MKEIISAWAKVNLTLRVTGKRGDGYHLLSSIFAKVSLCDSISISPSDDGAVTALCSDPSVPPDQRNLAVKAALALKKFAGAGRGARIEIAKKIPVAGGLGGGSADAAGVLAALNRMWGVGLSQEKLAEIALGLGADVPFFLGGPLAYVEGIGEEITPLRAQRAIPLLLANPGFGISAASAYKGSRFDFQAQADAEGLIKAAREGDPAKLAGYVKNDLEGWAMAEYPALARLKSAMENAAPKPLAAAMSGSGPTLFALYATMEAAQAAAESIKGRAPFILPAMTLAEAGAGGLQAL